MPPHVVLQRTAAWLRGGRCAPRSLRDGVLVEARGVGQRGPQPLPERRLARVPAPATSDAAPALLGAAFGRCRPKSRPPTRVEGLSSCGEGGLARRQPQRVEAGGGRRQPPGLPLHLLSKPGQGAEVSSVSTLRSSFLDHA